MYCANIVVLLVFEANNIVKAATVVEVCFREVINFLVDPCYLFIKLLLYWLLAILEGTYQWIDLSYARNFTDYCSQHFSYHYYYSHIVLLLIVSGIDIQRNMEFICIFM